MSAPAAGHQAAIGTRTFVDVLRAHAASHPSTVAFTYIRDGEDDVIEIRYEDLDRRARAIAAILQERTQPGDRALLLYGDALEFVAAFCACLYAGVIAVPAYPPRAGGATRPSRTDERLR